MNKERRKGLQAIHEKITDLRDELELLMGEEEDYRDNMPENLQGSEKYDRANDVCEMLDAAVSDLETVCENIEYAME